MALSNFYAVFVDVGGEKGGWAMQQNKQQSPFLPRVESKLPPFEFKWRRESAEA